MFAAVMAHVQGILILVIACSLCAFSLPTRSKRSEELLNSPCFNIPEVPAEPEEISSQISSLKTKAEDLLYQAENLKTYIVDGSNWHSTHVEYYTNNVYFLNISNMVISEEQLNTAVNEPTEALLSHRSHLFELAVYIQESRETGRISQLSGEDNLKTKLKDLETDIYNAICTVDIALVKQQVTVDVTVPQVSSDFISLGSNYSHERIRAFVLIKDGAILMDYLNATYTHMQASFR